MLNACSRCAQRTAAAPYDRFAISTKISTLGALEIKLDKVEKHLTDMNGSMKTMQMSFESFKQDIIANAKLVH